MASSRTNDACSLHHRKYGMSERKGEEGGVGEVGETGEIGGEMLN